MLVDELDGSKVLSWVEPLIPNHPPVSTETTRWEDKKIFHEEQQQLKAKLKQVEVRQRGAEMQRKDASVRQRKDALHYMNTRPRPVSLGIDPWRPRVEKKLSARKAEEQAHREALHKISPHAGVVNPYYYWWHDTFVRHSRAGD